MKKPYTSLINELQRNKDSEYTGGLIQKYELNFPSWVFVEILSFGSFCRFFRFCAVKFNDKRMLDFAYLLSNVKRLRNASAHNNCIIHNLKQGTTQIKTNHNVSKYVMECDGITKAIRKRKMSNAAVSDIVTLVYAHVTLVTSDGVRRVQGEKLKDVIDRCYKHIDYYKGNNTITSTFDFLKIIVDKSYGSSI